MTNFPPILQLDVAGNPQKWITFQDSVYHETKDNIAWKMGAVNFDVHGGTNALSGQQSIVTINTIIALKGKLSPRANKHYNRVPLTNKTLFRRDQSICAYCGETFPTHKLTRDHVIPTSRDGRNIWANVVTACASCNKMKDNHLLENISMQLRYIPYAPSRSEWLILQNRKVLADQMEFLLKRVPKESRLHLQ